MKKISILKNTVEEKLDGVIIERSLTESEIKESLESWKSLSEDEINHKINQCITDCKNVSVYKDSIKKLGLLYFSLDKDYKIVYIGSSSDITNDRLKQNDRIRTKLSKITKITANDIGWEYRKRIKYAVTFILPNYKNYELHLINMINPEFNSHGTKNYCSKWDHKNSLFSYSQYISTDILDSFHNKGIFNHKCSLKYKILPIEIFMKKELIKTEEDNHE
ncbi:hypothetical protein K5V21_06665 [Clostridium sardiniense]|uniref:GIY-YIG domain-containing protein n=1 Tax=Clostridium sardiniense TaxID=29369 RepID=A0ABS7KWN4_CLOSR|nr:hypothetical protein [Clostridium sardiniense]MBY0755134.1 hypothetical protein [Clostridium sardiniense]MDQ0459005.1 hypothetical protein [Clostridium sardiniense]